MDGKYFSDFVKRKFPILFSDRRKEKLFTMDNDPSQTSKAAMRAIDDVGAELFTIPARSPDLNPIENLFHIVKKELVNQVITQGIINESWCQFKTRVRKTVMQTSVTFIDNLLLSMPKRIDAVIQFVKDLERNINANNIRALHTTILTTILTTVLTPMFMAISARYSDNRKKLVIKS